MIHQESINLSSSMISIIFKGMSWMDVYTYVKIVSFVTTVLSITRGCGLSWCTRSNEYTLSDTYIHTSIRRPTNCKINDVGTFALLPRGSAASPRSTFIAPPFAHPFSIGFFLFRYSSIRHFEEEKREACENKCASREKSKRKDVILKVTS